MGLDTYYEEERWEKQVWPEYFRELERRILNIVNGNRYPPKYKDRKDSMKYLAARLEALGKKVNEDAERLFAETEPRRR